MKITSKKKDKEYIKNIDLDLCYAKSEKTESGDTVPGMTVYQHSYCAGKVAECLASQFPYSVSEGFFPDGYQLIVALHDIGKISPSFQYTITSVFDESKKLEIRTKLDLTENYHIKHSLVSYASLARIFGEKIAYIEGSHHGFLEKKDTDCLNSLYGGRIWQEARENLLKQLEMDFNNCNPKTVDDIHVDYLAGLTIISDWISSSISIKEFNDNPECIFQQKVSEAGFKKYQYKQGLSFEDIFGFEFRPQQKALCQSINEPGVYILESGTGSGKTEAALYAAYLMLEQGKGNGIYFALPSVLTSMSILGRVKQFLSKILEDEASVKLIFNNSFLYSCSDSEPSWFDSRKRLILAPFGVGTVDQALMSVISVKHSSVRTFGLAGKVVIIDEIHSYDCYTSTLIRQLINKLVSLGSTVIILSATLKSSDKASLIGCSETETEKNDFYPCVTVKQKNDIVFIPISQNENREVVLKHEENEKYALEKAVDDASEGRFVLWIENTVFEAQTTYLKLLSRSSDEYKVGLIHSRFTATDREKKEKKYLNLFGKNAWKDRISSSKGFILVGTQILEQSLDIDADVLYTKLAPADMIFQRIGRLWRHNHPERQGRPVCHIIHPDLNSAVNNPDVLKPSSFVYEPYVLIRTLSEIENVSSYILPNEIRKVLDRIYAPDSYLDAYETVKTMKSILIQNRQKKEALARRSQIRIGYVSDSEASTRYIEYKTKRVLILNHLNLKNSEIVLSDGNRLILEKSADVRENASISFLIEKNIVNVPENQIPEILPESEKLNNLLSKFIFIGSAENNDRICVLLRCGKNHLSDIFGNVLMGLNYNEEIGFRFLKEDTVDR